MDDNRAGSTHANLIDWTRSAGKGGWIAFERGFDGIADALESYAGIVRREGELFFGAIFVCIGLLGIQNGKNCDGNTAEYLTCTHPSTYYYYSWVQITLVVIGVFLLLLWLMRRPEEKKRERVRKTRVTG